MMKRSYQVIDGILRKISFVFVSYFHLNAIKMSPILMIKSSSFEISTSEFSLTFSQIYLSFDIKTSFIISKATQMSPFNYATLLEM